MPAPCIIDTATIALSISGIALEADVKIDGGAGNIIQVAPGGLRVETPHGVQGQVVADTSVWSYSDSALHEHQLTSIAIGNPSTTRNMSIMAVATWDPAQIVGFQSASGFQQFAVSNQLWCPESGAIEIRREVVTIDSFFNPYGEQCVCPGACVLSTAFGPLGFGHINLARYVQRVGNVNGTGYQWYAGQVGIVIWVFA